MADSEYRVIHIITSPDGGGAEKLVREFITFLPQNGVDAYAVYFSNPRGITLSERECCLDLKRTCSFRAFIRLYKEVKKLKSKNGITIVHAHLTWPLYYSAIFSLFTSFLFVFTEHNTHNKRRNFYCFRLIERLVYSCIQKIICISDATKTALENWLVDDKLSSKIVTITNGSRMLLIKKRTYTKGQPIKIVSVGSLSEQKGFDIAIKAVAKLGDLVSDYCIIGEGIERRRLELLVENLGLKNKVRMPGFVSEVEPFFHEADLGLMPSRWEGFGLVAVEALSTGLPMVVSDVPGLRDIVTSCDATLMCKPNDAILLSDTIEKAIYHLVGRHSINKNARLQAEQFNIEKMINAHVQLYYDLNYEFRK